MNANQPSAASARGRTERPSDTPSRPSLRRLVQNLIARVWFVKLVSSAADLLDKVPVLGASLRLRVAWVLMIFVIGFAGGVAWQSYGGGAGKSGASSERLKAMSLALSAARKDLDKLANEMSRLEAQGSEAPQRRSAR